MDEEKEIRHVKRVECEEMRGALKKCTIIYTVTDVEGKDREMKYTVDTIIDFDSDDVYERTEIRGMKFPKPVKCQIYKINQYDRRIECENDQ